MNVVPFLPIHLDDLDLIDQMEFMKPYLKDRLYAGFVDDEKSYSVTSNGKAIACGGMVKLDDFKWVIWALMGKETASHMTGITRAVKTFLEQNKKPRIEMHVRDGFDEAHKWAKILGFECETPNGMKNWADRKTYYLYSRCD